MKIARRLWLIILLLVSNAALSGKPIDTDAAVLKNIATILQIPVAKLKVDAPFSKQIVPGDALDIVEIVMAIEDDLQIEINDDALDKQIGSKGISDLPKKLTPKVLQETVRAIYLRKHKNSAANGR